MSDQTKSQPPDPNKILFINLMSMLAMSAMQQLGKIINPATGKASVSLEAAQATIDMLDMLDVKTNGNLDGDESKMMKETLTMLKLNYVETSKDGGHKQDNAKAQGGPSDNVAVSQPDAPTAQPTGTATPDTPAADAAKSAQPGTDKSKDAKFHKSYA